MRTTRLVGLAGWALLALWACGEEQAPSAPSATDSTPFFSITGFVLDSMLGLPLPGIRVAVGDSIAVTDQSGAFQLWQRRGASAVRINDAAYEPYTVPLGFASHSTVTVPLRGLAPYALQCHFQADTVQAVIVDLQGRKTLNRRTMTRLSARDNGIVRTADTWFWTPVDHLTWTAAVILPQSSIDSVEWRLEDQDGNVRMTSCVRTQGPCRTCGGTQ